MESLLYELIQLSIGRRDSLSRIPSENEWQVLYELSLKQTIAGVCFCGVQKLQKEMLPPKKLLLQWFAIAEQMKQRNVVLNERAKELTEKFSECGFRSCVLKGQGIAALYCDNDGRSLGQYRQSGDIDLWVEGERMMVLNFASSFGEVGLVDVKQAAFKCFEDVEVEIHSVPTFFYSPISQRKYRRWLNKTKNEQFTMSEMGFAHPSIEFNAVYVMIHIYRHLFDEGVGIRQLMDYYFVLLNHNKNNNGENVNNINRDVNHNANVGSIANTNRLFKEFGMERFVRAVMWVMQEVFGLERKHLLCEPSEKYGRRFLNIVMEGGNFGQYDKRNRHGKENVLQRGFRNLQHNMLTVKDYPSEVLWAPFWKVWHYVWRMINFGRVD